MQNMDRFKFKVCVTAITGRCFDMPPGVYDVYSIQESDFFGTQIVVFYNNKRYELSQSNCIFILLQSTGLKDKNGKLIFEGDVIKSDHYDDIYKVIYSIEGHFAGSFCLQNINNKKTSKFHQSNIWMPSDEPKNWDKIIGNIYENPELLNNL